jgi:hypothetical protein
MNWKELVEKQNAKTFVLPTGWDARDKVAEQLGCAPDRVAEYLRPSLKAGAVEQGQFPVWDAMLKRVVRVVAYRKGNYAQTQTTAATADSVSAAKSGAWSENEIALARKLRGEGKTWAQVGEATGRTRRAARQRLSAR